MRNPVLLPAAAALVLGVAAILGPAEARPLCQTQTVRVYKASWCGACRQLSEFLRIHEVRFREIDIDTDPVDPEAASILVGIPLSWTERGWVAGFRPSAFRQKLCLS